MATTLFPNCDKCGTQIIMSNTISLPLWHNWKKKQQKNNWLSVALLPHVSKYEINLQTTSKRHPSRWRSKGSSTSHSYIYVVCLFVCLFFHSNSCIDCSISLEFVVFLWNLNGKRHPSKWCSEGSPKLLTALIKEKKNKTTNKQKLLCYWLGSDSFSDALIHATHNSFKKYQ